MDALFLVVATIRNIENNTIKRPRISEEMMIHDLKREKLQSEASSEGNLEKK